MSRIIGVRAANEFDLEGRVVYHDMPGIYESPPKIDPYMHKLQIILASDSLIHMTISNYEINDKEITKQLRVPRRWYSSESVRGIGLHEHGKRVGKKFFEDVVNYFRGGDYQVHIFGNGDFNIGRIDKVLKERNEINDSSKPNDPIPNNNNNNNNNGLEID